MLSLYQFKSLSLPEQAEYARLEGRYLATRKIGRYQLRLYQLSGFFVEVFHQAGDQEVTDLRPFISRKNLEAYLPFLENQPD
jgi:hypothetical protein